MGEEWVSKEELQTLLGKQERQAERTVIRFGIKKEIRDTVDGKKPFFFLPDIQRALNTGKPKTPVIIKTESRPARKQKDRRPAVLPTAVPASSFLLEQKIFLTVKEAAFLSGLTEAFWERAITERRLSVVRSGGRKIYRRHFLDFCEAAAMTAAKEMEQTRRLEQGQEGK